MIRKIVTTVAIASAAMTYVASASAMDFYATPLNAGAPTNLPGERLIPGMTESMQLVNTVTQPILQPMLAPGMMPPAAAGEAPAAAPMMMKRHRHHRMSMKHKMMKHSMMKHSMMKHSMKQM